ncbi:MAG: hypothetical protein K0S04_3587 [Herbinix sp.]|nr:hypothetical protein [Herbinix sp.]
MVDLQDMVVTRIIGARNKKTAELEQLLGVEKRKPAIINPEFKNAVQKMVETDKCPKAGGRKVIELDEEQIRDLYVNKGMSYKGIAEKLKCSDFTIRKFCNQHGIIREAIPKNKLTYPVMTVEAVREIYTNGSTSLVDTAKYFGVNSNELHKFIEKHGLKRLVIKQNDPFLDVNKMSKDEFRRKMLLGKK